MVSGAGGAVARRRRDLRSWFLLFSFLSLNLPKNPNLSSSGFIYSDRHLCNGAREQWFLISLNQTSPTNQVYMPCDEGKKRLPASPFLSQSTFAAYFQKLKKENFCESSGAATFMSETSLIASLRSSRSGFLATSLNKSAHRTPSFERFTLHRRFYWTFVTPILNYREYLLMWCPETSATPVMKETANGGETLIEKVVSLNGLGPFPPCLLSGPVALKPIYKISDPSNCLLWPRSVSPLLRLSLFMPRWLFELGASLHLRYSHDALIFHPRKISPSLLCDYNICLRTLEVDWKKAQVDSKKILAQPHQSATANPSRQGADPESTPPAEEDWKKEQVDSKKILAQPHQSFKSMSFSFIPRSEFSIADDLAKKAVRSMTTGISMFL